MDKVYAQTDIGQYFSPSGTFKDFGSLATVIVKNAFVLAGVISFVFIVIGGFSVVMGAGGDSKKLEEGQKTLTMAVIGLIIVVGSYSIVQILSVITGFPLLGK